MIFVTLNSKQGDIARWEIGGKFPRLTHRASVGEPVEFTREVVDEMRYEAPEKFRIFSREQKPHPWPTLPTDAA